MVGTKGLDVGEQAAQVGGPGLEGVAFAGQDAQPGVFGRVLDYFRRLEGQHMLVGVHQPEGIAQFMQGARAEGGDP